MPTFLSDPPFAVYLVLSLAAIITLAIWLQRQTRNSLLAFAIAAACLCVILAIDLSVESPREEAGRRVLALCDAVTNRDPEAFLEHLAKSFDYRGVNREGIRTSRVWQVVQRFNARVAAWGFDRSDFVQLTDTEFEILFYCKGQARQEVQGQLFRLVKATFVKEADGQHRMKTLKFYSIEGGLRSEDPPPGFP